MKMRMAILPLSMAAILCLLTACDSNCGKRSSSERAGRLYQTAMDDYSAGRMEAAMNGFVRVVRESPLNASARFQLACLLQDVTKDYLGAICAYREYLNLVPDGEKTTIARDRLAICEREFRKGIVAEAAKRDGDSDDVGILERAQAAERENEGLRRELDEAKSRIAALMSEGERLRTLIASVGDDGDETGPQPIADLGNLLDDGEDDAEAPISVLDDEAKEVMADLDAEESDAGASAAILAAGNRSGKNDRKRSSDGSAKAEGGESKAVRERPERYVIEDGDTLYKIAIRFYGKSSAWKKIQEANRAIISTDGRVRAGQEIVLPK